MLTRTTDPRRACRLVIMLLGILVQSGSARPSEFVTPGEMQRKSDWVRPTWMFPARACRSHSCTAGRRLEISSRRGRKSPRPRESTRLARATP